MRAVLLVPNGASIPIPGYNPRLEEAILPAWGRPSRASLRKVAPTLDAISPCKGRKEEPTWVATEATARRVVLVLVVLMVLVVAAVTRTTLPSRGGDAHGRSGGWSQGGLSRRLPPPPAARPTGAGPGPWWGPATRVFGHPDGPSGQVFSVFPFPPSFRKDSSPKRETTLFVVHSIHVFFASASYSGGGSSSNRSPGPESTPLRRTRALASTTAVHFRRRRARLRRPGRDRPHRYRYWQSRRDRRTPAEGLGQGCSDR